MARANVAALAALTAPARRPVSAPYNIASGEPHTVGEMATALTDALAGPTPVVTHRVPGRRRPPHRRLARRGPAAELGFTASVPFAVGMKEFATAPLRS